MNTEQPQPNREVIRMALHAIRTIRSKRVILDTDLARIYGIETKRLNEQVKRNANRFPEDFVFQLTPEEMTSLQQEDITPRSWGGRRTRPYAFTEHGALQAATVLRSKLAHSVSIFVIRAFVQLRERAQRKATSPLMLPQSVTSTETPHEDPTEALIQGFSAKIKYAISQLLDTVVDHQKGTTVRDEAHDMLRASIAQLKERLKRAGLENEEILARITKMLAEAEKERAFAKKTRIETEQLEFMNLIRKLRLVLEAQKLIADEAHETNESERLYNFIRVLKELGDAPQE